MRRVGLKNQKKKTVIIIKCYVDQEVFGTEEVCISHITNLTQNI